MWWASSTSPPPSRPRSRPGGCPIAYLFTGTRGTGKTTCAKILARAANCLSPVNGNPCNQCENCRAVLEDAAMDVSEIDAASNNGVDNIREIREEVNYAPTALRLRTYIIDEVHMLSPGAFNALLKTLEEPPEHALFILATTEIHKVPATILSRCQRYDFRRISPAAIGDRLLTIARAENLSLSPEAALLLARLYVYLFAGCHLPSGPLCGRGCPHRSATCAKLPGGSGKPAATGSLFRFVQKRCRPGFGGVFPVL